MGSVTPPSCGVLKAATIAAEYGYDYLFWRIGLSKELLGFNLDLSYYDTNESEYFGNIGDDRIVFTISRSF